LTRLQDAFALQTLLLRLRVIDSVRALAKDMTIDRNRDQCIDRIALLPALPEEALVPEKPILSDDARQAAVYTGRVLTNDLESLEVDIERS